MRYVSCALLHYSSPTTDHFPNALHKTMLDELLSEADNMGMHAVTSASIDMPDMVFNL